jgi:hypothetical protein
MTTVELEADVPDSRQVTITLPPGVPTGRVRLVVLVGDPAPVPASGPDDPAVRAERHVFEAYLPRLRVTSPGRYVAVRFGMVLAVGFTAAEVESHVRAIHGPGPLYVGYVPPAEEEIIFSGQLIVTEAPGG